MLSPVPKQVTVQVSDPDGDAAHLDDLTRRLREELLGLDVPVEPAAGDDAPPGARGIELVAIGTLLLTVAQSPVLASVIDAISTWLGNRRHRTVKLEMGGDVLELSGAGGPEQRRLVDAWLNRHRGEQHPSLGTGRHALIVANHDYQDEGLRRLRAPAHDADQLSRVLRDPAIGGFDVVTLLNEAAPAINEAVEEFFADRRPDELLLLYFSGHGVKDEDGELYFAAAPTKINRLAATAVAADFVNRRMTRSRSRRIVLLLDCCYAGAFSRGMVSRGGGGVELDERFGGRGRAVITASSAMEYAFEGDSLTGESGPSVFTRALIEGLRTGEADRDRDGFIGLDELYDFIHDRVTAVTPNQTPGKWTFDLQGEMYIARRGTPVAMALPHGLQEAVDHQLPGVRAGAVTELDKLIRGGHPGLALAARLALERLADDDSRTVAAAASAALQAAVAMTPSSAAPPPTPPTPTPAPPTPTPATPPPATPTPPTPTPAPPRSLATPTGPSKRLNPMAVASFAAGLVAGTLGIVLPIALLSSLVAIVLGHLARRGIRRAGGRGAKLALAGLVLGYLAAAFLVFLIGGTILDQLDQSEPPSSDTDDGGTIDEETD